jgi:hypothetical protein
MENFYSVKTVSNEMGKTVSATVVDQNGKEYGTFGTVRQAVVLVEQLRKVAEVAAPEQDMIETFFTKWAAETVIWFSNMKAEYKEIGYKAFLDKYIAPKLIAKEDSDLIKNYNLDQIAEKVGKMMEKKKAALLQKIAGKVGTVTEMKLYEGVDGTPNGTVTGTEGSVNITTIYAGGEVQRLHYRVLVK